MNVEILPLLAFVGVTTFTPGPGNIQSASMGMLYGYRRSFTFLSGMVLGYLVIMMLCALLSSKVLQVLPAVEPVLRLAGACYILWLAVGTARASYGLGKDSTAPMSFTHGFLLQALNPKAVVFGITLYTTFLADIAGSPPALVISVVLLTLATFLSVSLWTLGGVQIQEHLDDRRLQRLVNSVLVALLVYSAVTLAGIF